MKEKRTSNRKTLVTALKSWRQRRSLPQKVFVLTVLLVFVIYIQGVAIAGWYINKHKNEPLNVGVTFISSYAKYFDLDPKQTLTAIRDELGIKRFRLVSYWDEMEKTPNVYDFSDLDWQFDEIEKGGGQVSLSIGLRQPRWPECHMPGWTKTQSEDQRQSELGKFMLAVIERYKNRPSLVSYQLENEYFLGVFGECPPSNRQDLVKEYNQVKSQDSEHQIIMSLSNNYFGIPVGEPRPDQFGVSVYKRVWDATVTKRYFEYPFTPTYYAYRAGLTEIFTGKSSILHELQAEPWASGGVGLKESSIAEQNKSMDVNRLKSRIQYGIDTGFRDIDLWGAEWWYWRKEKLQDPSLWNVVKESLKTSKDTKQN